MKSADLMELWAQEMEHLSPYRGSLRGTLGGAVFLLWGLLRNVAGKALEGENSLL